MREQNSQRAQADRQIREARLRLYTELLNKREEADTTLRKAIFDKVLDIYLKQAQNTDDKIVALELLTLNFNDSLDLSPLFWEIFREIQTKAPRMRQPRLMERLTQVANYVKTRQIELLNTSGDKAEGDFYTEVLSAGANEPFKMEKSIDRDFSFDDPEAVDPSQRRQTRHFRLYPLEIDQKNRRIYFSIEHGRPSGRREKISFWVDEYDFPLTTFSRISKSERFALVMRSYDPPYVGLTFIYFPSSRSGVKDKPFIDEVISNLVPRDDQK